MNIKDKFLLIYLLLQTTTYQCIEVSAVIVLFFYQAQASLKGNNQTYLSCKKDNALWVNNNTLYAIR